MNPAIHGIKIEVRGLYGTRDGSDVVRIESKSPYNVPYPFQGSNSTAYTEDGRVWMDSMHDNDLISVIELPD